MVKNQHSYLEANFAKLGIEANIDVYYALLKYVNLIYRWNKVYNLTSVKSIESMLAKHIIDSLTVLAYLPRKSKILDVGTGAGLPGIPLAMVNNNLEVSLLDSNSKKTCFLRQVANDLELKNTIIINSRIEDLQLNNYEYIISRGFASLINFFEITRHLHQPGTKLIAMKGVYPAAELAELKTLTTAVRVESVYGVEESERHIVIIG